MPICAEAVPTVLGYAVCELGRTSVMSVLEIVQREKRDGRAMQNDVGSTSFEGCLPSD